MSSIPQQQDQAGLYDGRKSVVVPIPCNHSSTAVVLPAMTRDQKKLKRKGERNSSSQISTLTSASDSTSSCCVAVVTKEESLERENGGNEDFLADDDAPILASATVRFKGIRQRTWGTWVAEVREPATKKRVWLGSYSSAEEAARVYDMALMLLQSPLPSRLNYPHDQRPVIIPSSVAEALVQTAHVGLIARQSGVKKRAGGKKGSAAQGDKNEPEENVSSAHAPVPATPTIRFASEWVEMSVVGASVSMREFTRADLPPPTAAASLPVSHPSPATVSSHASAAPATVGAAIAAEGAPNQTPPRRVNAAPPQASNAPQSMGSGHVSPAPRQKQRAPSGATQAMDSVVGSAHSVVSAVQTCLPGSGAASAVQHLGLPRSSLSASSTATDGLHPSHGGSSTGSEVHSTSQQQQQQHVQSVRYWPSFLPANDRLQQSVKQEAVAIAGPESVGSLAFVTSSGAGADAHERKPSLGLDAQQQQHQEQQQILLHKQQREQQHLQQQFFCYQQHQQPVQQQQQQQQQQHQSHHQQQHQLVHYPLQLYSALSTHAPPAESTLSPAQLQAWNATLAGISAAGLVGRAPPHHLAAPPTFPSPNLPLAAAIQPAGAADSERSSMLRMGLARPRGTSSPSAGSSPERRSMAEIAPPTSRTAMQQQQLTVGSVTVQGGMTGNHYVPVKKGEGMVGWAGDESPSSCLGSNSPPALILPCTDSFELPLPAVSSQESDTGMAGKPTSVQLPAVMGWLQAQGNGRRGGLCIEVPIGGTHGLVQYGAGQQQEQQQEQQQPNMGRTASQPILLSPGSTTQQRQQQQQVTSGVQSQAIPPCAVPWENNTVRAAAAAAAADASAITAAGAQSGADVRSQETLAPLQRGYHVVQQLQVQQQVQQHVQAVDDKSTERHLHNQQMLQQQEQQQVQHHHHQQQQQQQHLESAYSVAAAGVVAGAVAVTDAPPAVATEGDMCDADFLSDPAKEVYFMDDSEFDQLSPSKLHSFFPDQPMGAPSYHCGDGGGGGLFMLGGQVVDDRMFDEFLLDPDGMDAMEDSSNGSMGLGFEDQLMEEFTTPR